MIEYVEVVDVGRVVMDGGGYGSFFGGGVCGGVLIGVGCVKGVVGGFWL